MLNLNYGSFPQRYIGPGLQKKILTIYSCCKILLPVFQRVLKKKLSCISPKLNELGWFSIDELLNLCDATIIYKCINSLLQPSYKLFFSNVLTLMIIQTTQETKTISVYLCVAQRGFYYRALKTWNNPSVATMGMCS